MAVQMIIRNILNILRGSPTTAEPGLRYLSWGFTILISLLILYPLYELIHLPVQNLAEMWHRSSEIPRLGTILLNTVLLAFGSMALATLVAAVLAICRVNLTGRLGAFAHILSILPLVVPPLSGVVGWAFLMSPRGGYLNKLLRDTPIFSSLETGPFDVFTLQWIILITGIYLIPYAFIYIHAGLANIDPRLEDAARSSGSNWLGVQIRIVLPLLRPALLYGGGLVTLLALGQFTAPLLLGRTNAIDVITTQLYRLTSSPPTNYPLAAFIAMPILFIALVGVALQRHALRGGLRFLMTGRGQGRARINKPVLLLPIIVYSSVLVIPPIIALVLVALTPFWGAPISLKALDFSAIHGTMKDELSLLSIKNSILYAAVATLICLALSLIAGLNAQRGERLSRIITDYVVNVPLAVPATLFGMALFASIGLGPLTVYLQNHLGLVLYGSATIMVLAYVILVLPHGTRLTMSGLAQINPQLEAAARICGSSAIGAAIRILIPLLRKNLISAAMLMFVLLSHEFAASSLLFGPDTQVIATLLYSRWETGSYQEVAALALVMIAVAVIGLCVIAALDIRSASRRIENE